MIIVEKVRVGGDKFQVRKTEERESGTQDLVREKTRGVCASWEKGGGKQKAFSN